MKIAIIELISGDTIPYDRHLNSYDVASLLKAEGHAVSLSSWPAVKPLDELFMTCQDADRILLWDEAVYVDLPATRLALGGAKLSEALDQADVMAAPCPSGVNTLAVFSGAETFAKPRADLGAALVPDLEQARGPVPCAAFPAMFVWIHAAALARLLPPTPPVMIAGLDCALSRRFIEGGATVMVDARIAVTSRLVQTVPWSLPEPTPSEQP